MAEGCRDVERSLQYALHQLRNAMGAPAVTAADEAKMAEMARSLEEDDDGHETEAIESSSATSN